LGDGPRLRPKIPTSARQCVSEASGLRRRVNTNIEHEIPCGDRLVKMTIFLDNIRCIPESRQRGRNCCACGGQAIYAQLDERNEPLAYFV